MEPITIIMLVLAVLLVIGSCILPEKEEQTQSGVLTEESLAKLAKRELSEEELLRISEAVDRIVSDKTEEIILKTDDYLSNVANEKIMAVDEFSKQILARLEKDNSDATFLYKMISEAKDEMKTDLESARQEELKLARLCEESRQLLGEEETSVPAKSPAKKKSTKTVKDSEIETATVKKDTKKTTKADTAKGETTKSEATKAESAKGSRTATTKAKQTTSDSAESKRKLKAQPTANEKKLKTAATLATANETEDDIGFLLDTINGKNEEHEVPKQRILELYRQGRSIREISRELSMGQGEVKLIIGLYGN